MTWSPRGLCWAALGALFLSGCGGSDPSPQSPPAISPASAPQAFRSGQFWYTRTISTVRERRPAGGEFAGRDGFMHARGPEVAFVLRVSVETWAGVDGTMRQRTIVVSQRFASATARRHWLAYHRPAPRFSDDIDSDSLILGDGRFPASGPSGDPLGPQDIGDGAFRYGQLQSLPTQPAALLRRIQRAFAALARRQANSAVDRCGYGAVTGCNSGPPAPRWQQRDSLVSQDMTNIAEMLGWPIPARLRRALYHAATTLPTIGSDVTVDVHARDRHGRKGVAIIASPPRYPGHYEPDPMWLMFAPATGELLAQPGFGDQGVVTAQGVVGSFDAVPRGVNPIRAPAGLPPPPAALISPSAGSPRTVFKVTVTGFKRSNTSARGLGLGGGVSGPVYRGCSSGFNSPTPPSPPPRLSFSGTAPSRSGKLSYVYTLAPPAGTGHTWCTGRYQLQLYPPALGASGPTGVGTAIYFQIK